MSSLGRMASGGKFYSLIEGEAVTKRPISYERAPSKELCALFAPGQFLSEICDLHRNNVDAHGGLGLDIHFRCDDEIHVYRGLTRVFVLKRMRNGVLRASADEGYIQYDRERVFFREWGTHESGFKRAMDSYLRKLKIDPRYTAKEGRIQMKWSRVSEPWMAFDREARLQYKSKKYRIRTKVFAGVEDALGQLSENYDSHRNEVRHRQWAKPKGGASELDQLAISPDGQLVLVELKDAERGKEREVYYSPFQLLQYVWEWHEALRNNAPQLLAQVQSLLDSRVALGLVGTPATHLTGDIRAAVCFGRDGRSDEVRQRYSLVLDVCNRHLPEGVEPIETWEYGAEAPSRIGA